MLGADDSLTPVYVPQYDPEAPVRTTAIAPSVARRGAFGIAATVKPLGGANAQPDAAACEQALRARDPWSIDLVVCERCERMVLRPAFVAHAAICVATPADADPIFLEMTTGAAGAASAADARKIEASPGEPKFKKQKAQGKSSIGTSAAGRATAAAGRGVAGAGRGAGARVGGKALAGLAGSGRAGGGGKVPSRLGLGRGTGGAAATGAGGLTGAVGAQHALAAERVAAAAQAAAAPDQHAADRLRRSEIAMLRTQWLSLVGLLKAPPAEPSYPLAQRDAVHRGLLKAAGGGLSSDLSELVKARAPCEAGAPVGVRQARLSGAAEG